MLAVPPVDPHSSRDLRAAMSTSPVAFVLSGDERDDISADIVLPEDAFERFEELLENPPAPSRALRELFRKPPLADSRSPCTVPNRKDAGSTPLNKGACTEPHTQARQRQ